MENVVAEPETAPESDVRFPVVMRGYDRRQVDEYVRVVEKRVERHERARKAAERKLSRANIPGPRAAETDLSSGLGKRIEKILEVAESEAAEIKRHARKESAQILAAAEKTAADAEAARAETERAAHEEAQAIVSRAGQEAAAIREAHQTALTELGQIADILTEIRHRFDGDSEDPAETDAVTPVPSSSEPA